MRTPASTVRTPLPGRPGRRPTATAIALTLGLVALAGCSGGSDEADTVMSDTSGGGAVEQTGGDLAVKEYGDAGAAAPPADAPAQGGTVGTTVDPATVAASVSDRQLARRADISVTVEDVDAAATKVRAIATAAQGLVLSESIASESDIAATGGFSSITISVPTDQLDATLDRVSAIGEVYSRTTSTEDVTAQVIDTQSRLKTMQASVERVRALMTQATKLGEIVTLEAELSRRQADLEALQTQLAALEDAVALAPVEVRLSTDEQVLADAGDDTGFLAGLTAGWRA
ncbi:MAG TPA: DUF4349 domain-containing protein, partial [Ornithinibacter sp.]|nr:DUF4349 domain-containing protein [Ornithinibacter sp.]